MDSVAQIASEMVKVIKDERKVIETNNLVSDVLVQHTSKSRISFWHICTSLGLWIKIQCLEMTIKKLFFLIMSLKT